MTVDKKEKIKNWSIDKKVLNRRIIIVIVWLFGHIQWRKTLFPLCRSSGSYSDNNNKCLQVKGYVIMISKCEFQPDSFNIMTASYSFNTIMTSRIKIFKKKEVSLSLEQYPKMYAGIYRPISINISNSKHVKNPFFFHLL